MVNPPLLSVATRLTGLSDIFGVLIWHASGRKLLKKKGTTKSKWAWISASPARSSVDITSLFLFFSKGNAGNIVSFFSQAIFHSNDISKEFWVWRSFYVSSVLSLVVSGLMTTEKSGFEFLSTHVSSQNYFLSWTIHFLSSNEIGRAAFTFQ